MLYSSLEIQSIPRNRFLTRETPPATSSIDPKPRRLPVLHTTPNQLNLRGTKIAYYYSTKTNQVVRYKAVRVSTS